MVAAKAARPALARTSGEPRAIDLAGEPIKPTHIRDTQNPQAPIRAALIGSARCEAVGVRTHGSAPVLALCRALVGAGLDPRRALHAYRGEILCLRVPAIGAAAQIEPSPRGVGFIRLPRVRGGSLVRQNVPAVVHQQGTSDGGTP